VLAAVPAAPAGWPADVIRAPVTSSLPPRGEPATEEETRVAIEFGGWAVVR
jgi:hypothetical protein